MKLSEPMTLATDYLLAVFSAGFGLLLMRAHAPRNITLWIVGFLALAGAGITGGTFHGFRHALGDSTLRSLWNITLLLIGAATGFMISAAMAGPLPWAGENTRWMLAGIGVTLVGVIVQQGHIAPHPRFNHNDLFHVLQIVALYCLFRGARLSA